MILMVTMSQIPSIQEHADLTLFLLSISLAILVSLLLYVFKTTTKQFSDRLDSITTQFSEKLTTTVDQFEKSVNLFTEKIHDLEDGHRELECKHISLELKFNKIETEHNIFHNHKGGNLL